MDYQAALSYILSFADMERSPGFAYSGRFDLRRMEDLLERLGQPHLGPRTIHIAGSKGKGSTAAMISAGLGAAGYRTGLYTSPHLHTLRERISVNGRSIAEQELAALVERLRPEVEAVNDHRAYGELTTFELLTALAFLYFREQGVDFQVLETGLGGRLDATNVVSPQVCVLTSISLDHTEVLGSTIAQIAWEKAGIIKEGSLVVSSPQPPEAAAVIRETCARRGAGLITVGSEVTGQEINGDLSRQSLRVKGRAGSYNLTIPLLGEHQAENAATAVAALEAVSIPPEAITSGLGAVSWPGRLEILRQEPMVVVDGAHNADSAAKLRKAINHFPFERLVLIIGSSTDKDMPGIVAELAALPDRVIVTRSRHPRAAAPSALASEFQKYGVRPQPTEDVAEALAQALSGAGRKDLILAAGSLFVVAEVIQQIKGIPAELYPQQPGFTTVPAAGKMVGR